MGIGEQCPEYVSVSGVLSVGEENEWWMTKLTASERSAGPVGLGFSYPVWGSGVRLDEL
jgi:hypothetical protein